MTQEPTPPPAPVTAADRESELRALMSAATAGPWHVYDGSLDNDAWYEGTTIGSALEGSRICDMSVFRTDAGNRANAALIVAAENALTAHLDRIEQLEEIEAQYAIEQGVGQRQINELSSRIRRLEAALRVSRGWMKACSGDGQFMPAEQAVRDLVTIDAALANSKPIEGE